MYITATSEVYDRGYISDAGWVRSARKLADGLIKFSKGQSLVDFLDSGRLVNAVGQWQLREDFQCRDSDAVYKFNTQAGTIHGYYDPVSQLFHEKENGECRK